MTDTNINRQVLLICNDYYHPGEIVKQGLSFLNESGYNLTVDDQNGPRIDPDLASFPLTILARANMTMNSPDEKWMDAKLEEKYKDYVEAGGSLLVIHAGTARYANSKIFRLVIGGVFKSHPNQCTVTYSGTCKHTLLEGVTDFSVLDEHYFMDIEDSSADHFLKSVSEYGEQPAGWTRRQGQGKVCLMTPGHNLEVWQHTSFQRLILNSLDWLLS